MNHKRNPWLGLLLWGAIYYFSLYFLPRLAPLRSLRQSLDWLGSGDITQTFFLIFSLTAMLIIGKGNLRDFGFKGVRLTGLVKPVLTTIVAEIGIFIIGMIVMSIVNGPGGEMTGGESCAAPGNAPGPGPEPGQGPDKMPGPMAGGLLSMIISVWIYASVIEEVFYRGLCQSLLERWRQYSFPFFRVRISLPVILLALAFGLGHLCLSCMFSGIFLWQIIVSCTALGLIAGYYREKTGSLIPAIVAHSTANIVGCIFPMLLMQIMPG